MVLARLVARSFNSRAMTTGVCNGTLYIDAGDNTEPSSPVRKNEFTYHHIVWTSMGILTYGYQQVPHAASQLKHLLKVLRELVGAHLWLDLSYVPASLLMPSFPATTHEALQMPHTSLSFPSFTHPHLDAATASITVGLLA